MNQEDFGRADGLQDGMPSQHHAGPNPDPNPQTLDGVYKPPLVYCRMGFMNTLPGSWTVSWPASTGRPCLFYLDDIIVFAATWEEHLDLHRQVFECLRHAQLKLSADKCTFASKEVSYLGHRVTEEGLLPDPSLLAAIREISPPKNAAEVRSFLGLAGYYRRYVKNFAAIAGPLHSLTRKDAVFHWGPDCQDAFDRLKTLLTTSPITASPDFSLPFRLYTDASTVGLGAILAQVQEGK